MQFLVFKDRNGTYGELRVFVYPEDTIDQVIEDADEVVASFVFLP